jgi:putative DNA primase/helicase
MSGDQKVVPLGLFPQKASTAKDATEAAAPKSVQAEAAATADIKSKPKPRPKQKPQLELDPTDPMYSARILLEAKFTGREDELPQLHRHRGSFWLWTGSYFRLTDDETIRAEIWKFLERSYVRGKSGKAFKPNRARVGDVLDALGAVALLDKYIDPPAFLSTADAMPPPAEFLACANGLLHLPSGELYPPTADYFNISASDVRFDEDAPPPKLWLQFLDQIFDDDEEAKTLLQDFFGYVLSPDTSQQKILLAIGPRRCGKGTIARILTALLGKASVGGPTMSGLAGEFGLEPLVTKSLAIISDARIGARTNKAVIVERLLSISGEDSLTISRKHTTALDQKLPTRIMILSNELPTLSDSSGALAGRYVILLMKKSFLGKEDPALTAKLLTELPGILNWALVGYRRLRERGHFAMPESANEASDKIEMLGAPIKAFINDECNVATGLAVAHDVLFDGYRLWRRGQGMKDDVSKQWFGRELMAALPGLTTRRPAADDGAKRASFYVGIALKQPVSVPF